jgi:prepilin-type processing-associated H-X9-DG protein
MGQAAHMHALEHKGYLPAAGCFGPAHLFTVSPEGLKDKGMTKYMWYRYGTSGEMAPLPLPAALGHYMGLDYLTHTANMNYGQDFSTLDAAMKLDAVRIHFTCPAQAEDTIVGGATAFDASNGGYPKAYMSYVFNGTALGRVVEPWGETPAGQLSRIRHPEDVFLFADGLCKSDVFPPHYTGLALFTTEERLADHYRWGRGGGNFDFVRHRGRINVLFVDGHVETLMLPDPTRQGDPGNYGDLARAGLSKGIY